MKEQRDFPPVRRLLISPAVRQLFGADALRLLYLLKDGPDGFAHVEKDRHVFAMERAEAAGRDEPSEMDELNGFRLLIDAAMDADPEWKR